MKQKAYTAMLLVIIVLIAGGLYWYLTKDNNSSSAIPPLGSTSTNPTPASPANGNSTSGIPTTSQSDTANHITVTTQQSGSAVNIDELTVAKPSYVVIYDNKNGVMGTAVAHSNLLSTGTKQDLLINAKLGVGTYYAVVVGDNGDNKYDLTTDLPIKLSNGSNVMAKFQVQ